MRIQYEDILKHKKQIQVARYSTIILQNLCMSCPPNYKYLSTLQPHPPVIISYLPILPPQSISNSYQQQYDSYLKGFSISQTAHLQFLKGTRIIQCSCLQCRFYCSSPKDSDIMGLDWGREMCIPRLFQWSKPTQCEPFHPSLSSSTIDPSDSSDI